MIYKVFLSRSFKLFLFTLIPFAIISSLVFAATDSPALSDSLGYIVIESDQGDPAKLYVNDTWHLWPVYYGTNNPRCSCWDFDSNGKVSFCIGEGDYIPYFKSWAEACLDAFKPDFVEPGAWADSTKPWDYKIEMDTSEPSSNTAADYVWVTRWVPPAAEWESDWIYYEILEKPSTSCTNNIRDADEEGVDCGGSECEPCGRCVPLYKNGESRDKIDVIFVGSNFSDVETFDEVVNESIDYFDSGFEGLMSVEPFRSNKERFNFWRINESNLFNANNYEAQTINIANRACPFGDERILLSVNPRFVPHAYIHKYTPDGDHRAYVTIGCEYLGECPWPLDISGSRFGSNKESVARTIIHEFGHSFGGLADEYDYNSNDLLDPRNTPNCDNSTCAKWSGVSGTSCISVCGYRNWFRAYRNTIMRSQYDLSATFRQINEGELLRDIERATDNTLAGTGASTTNSYLLELVYDKGSIVFGDLELLEGEAPNRGNQPNNGYIIKILSSSNTTLYSFKFNFPLYYSSAPPSDWFDSNNNQIIFPNESCLIELDYAEMQLVIPYFDNAENIEVYDPQSNLLMTINISDYAEEPTPQSIDAEINIDPDTLNLKSKGKWITTYIEFPLNYDVMTIDVNSVKLNNLISAESNLKYGFVKDPEPHDSDSDGIPEFMVKFDRSTVQDVVSLATGLVTLNVQGDFDKGTFKGEDTINVKG